MFSLVLPSFCVLLHYSCIEADQVTHMPQVDELTLAPNVVEAMQNGETVQIQQCVDKMQQFLRSAMSGLDQEITISLHKAVKGLPLYDMTPCSQCRILNNDLESIKVNELIIYKYLEDSYILDAYLGLPKVHLECDSCVLTDNGGNRHSGDIDFFWTEPRINVLAEDVFENFGVDGSWQKFLKFNATNVNRNTVQGTCKGDDTFKEVCKQSHDSGELDRVMHAASERLFKLEEKDLPEGDLQVYYEKFKTSITDAFTCTV